MAAATHRSCCLRRCLLAVSGRDAAIFEICGRSARLRCGRNVDTDQSDKQQGGSDGPKHMGFVTAYVPKYTALPNFTPFNKQSIVQSHKPTTSLLPTFYSQNVVTSRARVLVGEVTQELGDFTPGLWKTLLLCSVRAKQEQ
jgi:hypothetical protein